MGVGTTLLAKSESALRCGDYGGERGIVVSNKIATKTQADRTHDPN